MTQEPPPREYPVGAIVIGHVWTGTEWAPAFVVPNGPQPLLKPTSASLIAGFDRLNARFNRMPALMRISVIVVGFAIAVVVSLYASYLVGGDPAKYQNCCTFKRIVSPFD